MTKPNGKAKLRDAHVYLSQRDYDQVVSKAQKESRSVNKQVEYYVRQGLERDRQKA